MIIVSCYPELNSPMNDEDDNSDMNLSEIEERNKYIGNNFCTKC